MAKVLFIILFGIIINVVDSVGDAFKKRGEDSKILKKLGWISEDLLLFLTVGVMPFFIVLLRFTWIDVTSLVLTFVLFRIALFNTLWNLAFFGFHTFKSLWYYYGSTKTYDKILGWFIEKSWFAKKFKPRERLVVFVIQASAFIFAFFTSSGLARIIENTR